MATSRWRAKPTRLLLQVAGVVGLLLAGLWVADWVHFHAVHLVTDDARVDGDVKTLASRVNGWVVKLPVIEGDAVRVGQVLASIDDRETRLKRDALAAQLASIVQQRVALQAQIRNTDATTRAQLDSAQGRLQAALASRDAIAHRVELARGEFRRSEDLAAKRFLSSQALEQAKSALAQVEAELRRADGDIVASRGSLTEAQAQRSQIEVLQARQQGSAADADQIRAQIATLDAELADRSILSPVDGIVVMTFVRENEYVAAGQRLMMVHDPRAQWIEANIKETDIADVRIGQPTEVRADSYPDRVFKGRVARIGAAATSKFALLPDPNPSGNFTKVTQRLPVRIVLDAPDPALRPGMMVEVAIDRGQR